MPSRQPLQTNTSSSLSSTQTQSSLATRPFAPQPQVEASTEPLQSLENLEAKPEKSARANHSLSTLAIGSAPSINSQPIQTKLEIGAPGDKYEQEADRVANQVVNRLQASSLHPLQKADMPEEEDLQMKPVVDSIQRADMPEEEDLQMRPLLQRQSGAMDASPDVEQAIEQVRGKGQPLDDTIRQPMEQAFGADFSGVRVHTGGQSDQLNRSIQARAFTTGQEVFFRQGEYQPSSRNGQELLAHELTHVIQQNGKSLHKSPRIQGQYIQRAPWSNAAAKFRTDNDNSEIPNSEYLVDAASYKRYAPINEVRAPGQVYHEGPRNFAYLPPNADKTPAWRAKKATAAGKTVTLEDKKGNTVDASVDPQNGYTVWDSNVKDDGKVSGSIHVGHAVEELGKSLPTLDDPERVKAIDKQQLDVQVGQATGLIASDRFYIELYFALEDGETELSDGTEVTPELISKAKSDLDNVKENGIPPEIAHKLMVKLANR